MSTTKTVHLIGGPDHGKTVVIKAGVSFLYFDGTTITTSDIEEVVVYGCSFYVSVHPQATATQRADVIANLRELVHAVRPLKDGRVTYLHPGLEDEMEYAADRAEAYRLHVETQMRALWPSVRDLEPAFTTPEGFKAQYLTVWDGATDAATRE